jgi:hypothetical protein
MNKCRCRENKQSSVATIQTLAGQPIAKGTLVLGKDGRLGHFYPAHDPQAHLTSYDKLSYAKVLALVGIHAQAHKHILYSWKALEGDENSDELSKRGLYYVFESDSEDLPST